MVVVILVFVKLTLICPKRQSMIRNYEKLMRVLAFMWISAKSREAKEDDALER